MPRQSKTAAKKDTQTTPVEEVTAPETTTPVAKPAQKRGGRRAAAPKKSAEETPVETQESTPVETETPVETPVETETPVESETAPKRRGGRRAAPKKSAEETESAQETPAESAPTETTPKRGGRRAAPKKSTEETAEDEDDASSSRGGERTFKLLLASVTPSVSDEKLLSGKGGRYVGKTPMQAAKKAFTQLARRVNEGAECEYTFTIQESTQGCKKAKRSYHGKRVKLDEPQTVQRSNTSYTIRFKNDVRSVGGTEA